MIAAPFLIGSVFVCSRSRLRSGENAEVSRSPIDMNHRDERIVFIYPGFRSMNSLWESSIASFHIGAIKYLRRFSKILKSIIRPIAIDMINLELWIRAGDKAPDQTMCVIQRSINPNADISIGCPGARSLAGEAAVSLPPSSHSFKVISRTNFPDQRSSQTVVVEAVAKKFSIHSITR